MNIHTHWIYANNSCCYLLSAICCLLFAALLQTTDTNNSKYSALKPFYSKQPLAQNRVTMKFTPIKTTQYHETLFRTYGNPGHFHRH